MQKKTIVTAFLLAVLAFMIPIEHKYDKLFRFYSLTLIPDGLLIPSGYEKKIYFYISDLIAIALLGMSIFWHRISLKKLFFNPLWIVFLFAFLSILASPFSHYPIPYFRLLQLLTPIALFSFVTNCLGQKETVQITRIVLIAIVAAGLFQTLVATLQYFNQAPLGLRLLGEINLMGSFNVPNSSRWLFDEWMNREALSGLVMRAQGTLPHPNVLGGFLVLSLLASFALYMRISSRLIFFTIPLQFFALCLSFSRAALFSFGIAACVWFYLNGFKNNKVRQCIWILLFSGALSATLLGKQLACRGGIVNYNDLARGSDEIRKYHQKKSTDIILDHPFLGVGFSQFSIGAAPYFEKNKSSYIKATAPHNIYLFLLSETGFISLAAFLLWIAILLANAFRGPKNIETATFSAMFLTFLCIGFCDFYPILFQQGKLMFFLSGALLVANAKAYVVKETPIYDKSTT